MAQKPFFKNSKDGTRHKRYFWRAPMTWSGGGNGVARLAKFSFWHASTRLSASFWLVRFQLGAFSPLINNFVNFNDLFSHKILRKINDFTFPQNFLATAWLHAKIFHSAVYDRLLTGRDAAIIGFGSVILMMTFFDRRVMDGRGGNYQETYPATLRSRAKMKKTGGEEPVNGKKSSDDEWMRAGVTHSHTRLSC